VASGDMAIGNGIYRAELRPLNSADILDIWAPRVKWAAMRYVPGGRGFALGRLWFFAHPFADFRCRFQERPRIGM